MHIQRGKKKDYNKFVYSGSFHGHTDLDSKVAMSKACKAAVKDASYTNEEYNAFLYEQTLKFINRYPSYFAREIKPELTELEGKVWLWNIKGVQLAMRDSYEWMLFRKALDKAILDFEHYDWEKEITTGATLDVRDAALDSILDSYQAKKES